MYTCLGRCHRSQTRCVLSLVQWQCCGSRVRKGEYDTSVKNAPFTINVVEAECARENPRVAMQSLCVGVVRAWYFCAAIGSIPQSAVATRCRDKAQGQRPKRARTGSVSFWRDNGL